MDSDEGKSKAPTIDEGGGMRDQIKHGVSTGNTYVDTPVGE
jgi:hypothetical protein